MDHFEPYFAVDTEGVHFAVLVDDKHEVWAYAGSELLVALGSTSSTERECLRQFHLRREQMVAAVVRRVRREGLEVVILRASDFSLDDMNSPPPGHSCGSGDVSKR
jgi:hypothetical protein